MSEEVALPFTGERFTPECVREIWYEHWHRYAFAQPLVRGKRVLDAACGEGYGSDLLAQQAAQVIGLDISTQTIDHARARYAHTANVTFQAGDAAVLPFADASFDVVVSFETLEHLAAQDELVRGFARVLGADGVLVMSSPDRTTYSEAVGFHNEFHVRELDRNELLDLLGAHFRHVRLYAQKLLFQSVLWSLDDSGSGCHAVTATGEGRQLSPGLGYAPIYYIALCSNGPLPEGLPQVSLFGDDEETVYSHYNHEIRKNMAAGERIAQLEAELDTLRAAQLPSPETTAPRRWWRRR